MKKKILIADDEAPGRARLIKFFEAHPGEYELYVAKNGYEAIELTRSIKPDLLMLDIEMPEIDGFDVLRHLEPSPEAPRPRIVFQTAYDQFAIKAFEVNACDYLLKPFNDERLSACLKRVFPEMPLPNATNNPTTQLDTYLSQEGHYQRKFVIRTGGKSRIAAEDEVLYFFSEHHATTIVLEKMAFDYDLPLNTLEIRLDPSKFLRLHRNSIVRIDQIASFTHDREAEITLKNGTRLQASRGASQELKKRLRPD